MALVPVSAYGTVIDFATVAYAGVKSISGPGVSVDMLDVSTHDAGTGYRTFVPGLADGGELTVEAVFDDANEAIVAAHLATPYNNSVLAIEITFPGDIVWAFNAFISGYEPSAAVDGDCTATITLKVTGAITYDP
ncbi:MAG TPA: phage tail tube protein [Thermoguttaceae bacterium]|nr:phage tail tube protein [Thermoguttaceae bacterium]